MRVTTNPFDDDKLHEECGVFGIYDHPDAAALTALGLHALQHRGQEASGIVTVEGDRFHIHRALGHVDDAFGSEEVMETLQGNIAIGHNRYATSGATVLRNVQPLYADLAFGGFAIGHNGNLTNANTLRHQLVQRGALFQSTSDTEAIVHLMAMARGGNVVDRLIEALRQVEGAYSIVACSEDRLIGVRDPHGVRPLMLGKLGDSHVLASESCAFDIIGAEFVRNIEPGELVVIKPGGEIATHRPFQNASSRFCIFEYVYFARPDSVVEDRSVYEMRRQIGVELAREAPPPDHSQTHPEEWLVVPVPDSGVPSAIGYAAESGVPFELGIIRNHYVGRTFIQPTDNIRHLGVKLKHNANKSYIEGKRIILVDDSIVRGTTSKKIVEMMREAGAREVHMRISSPPTAHSCFYGIDTPEQEELFAHRFSVEEIGRRIGADSLSFVTIDGLYRAVGEAQRDPQAPQFCDACFTGDYPIRLVDHASQDDTNAKSGLDEKKRRTREKTKTGVS